jgi:hypothetical protein
MEARTLAIAIVTLAAMTPSLSANAADSIGSFKQWNAYASNEASGKVCFIASQPTDSKYSQPVNGRDAAFFMITTIPTKNVRNEASTIIGYAFKGGSKVTVDVDGTQFTMFTDKDSAWIETPPQEPALIDAMKKGRVMTVQGTSSRGTVSTDTYSLAGITAALDAIAKACP